MTDKPNRKQRRAEKSIERRQAYGEPIRLVDDHWYTDKQVAQLYGGVHPVTIWRWARLGLISKPVALGPNTSRWLGRSIREDQEAKRTNAAA
jgi:predicted DNA-binding transcriptional regulator AlpA